MRNITRCTIVWFCGYSFMYLFCSNWPWFGLIPAILFIAVSISEVV